MTESRRAIGNAPLVDARDFDLRPESRMLSSGRIVPVGAVELITRRLRNRLSLITACARSSLSVAVTICSASSRSSPIEDPPGLTGEAASFLEAGRLHHRALTPKQAKLMRLAIANYRKAKKLLRTWEEHTQRLIELNAPE